MKPELQQRSRYLMLVLPSMFSWRKVNMTDVQKSGTTILKNIFFIIRCSGWNLPLNGLRIFGYKSLKSFRFYFLKIAFFETLPGLCFCVGKDSCFYQYTHVPSVYSF